MSCLLSWEILGKHVAEKRLFLKAICRKRYKENSEQKSDSTEFNYSFEVTISISLNWMVLAAHVVFITEGGGYYIFCFLGQTLFYISVGIILNPRPVI